MDEAEANPSRHKKATGLALWRQKNSQVEVVNAKELVVARQLKGTNLNRGSPVFWTPPRRQSLPGAFAWRQVLKFVGKDGQSLRQVFFLSNDPGGKFKPHGAEIPDAADARPYH